MNLFKTVALLFCLLVIIGCTQPGKPPSTREHGVLLLDNRGGFSHPGRRIVLRADGSYTDTSYTDVVGDEQIRKGLYTLNPERTHLILSPQGGAAEELVRVDHDGQQYWVLEANRERITQPRESMLRQRSVRVIP